MDDHSPLTLRLRSLERRWRLTAGLTALLGALVLASAARPAPKVLTARGLLITDAQGRPRIVLGAPMATVTADPKLADTVGLAVLDSRGRMSTALGVDAPLVFSDGTVARRVYEGSVGLTIYDPRSGGERGGFAVHADGHAVACLDYARDREAVCMSVGSDDAFADVQLMDVERQGADRVGMFVGQDGAGIIKVGGGGKNPGGFLLKTGIGPTPELVTYDRDFRQVAEVVWKPTPPPEP